MEEPKKEIYRNKIIILSIVITIVILAIIGLSLLLIKDLSSDEEEGSTSYGLIKDVQDGYIIVSDIDGEETTKIATDNNYSVGDFVHITDDNIDVIANKDELNTLTETTKEVSSAKTTKEPTSKTSESSLSKDEQVVKYMEDANTESEKEESQSKLKEAFIKCIDFIFYDGTINGITWDELSTKAKTKVIYYTLLIDQKIENKFPNYKESIGNKVQDIKARLVAKYMDLAVKVCETTDDDCFQVKSDFALLKNSLKITWDIIKSAFSYGYEKSTTYLKNWYEVFSGKI